MADFPVTAKDQPQPSDPKEEPTREWVNQHPENLTQRIERTRRYFRLLHLGRGLRYAAGLDTDPDDFA